MNDPIVILHPHEKWHPVDFDDFMKLIPCRWVINGVTSNQRVDPSQIPPVGAQRIDFPNDMKPPNLPPVGYVRDVRGGALIYRQYWLFYPYNPGPPLISDVAGPHEADIEFFQVGMTPDALEPVLVAASQHHGGEVRLWDDCEMREDRLVIYSALGSHANYFTPGVHPGGPDVCGNGELLNSITWKPFGQWVNWPQLIGNSTGPGRSPVMPMYQVGNRWDNVQHFGWGN